MTTTNLYSGYDPSGKPSSRVLNPPGGRSNNIFGGGEPDEAQGQKVEQHVAPKEPLDQNQNAGATSSPAQQTKPMETDKKKVQYNPITGEEIPATHVKQKKAEEKNNGEEESKDENAEKETEENTSSNATSFGATEQQPTKKPNNPSIKVRQPPGGKSSGLW